MKVLEFNKAKISRRKTVSSVDKSTTPCCVLSLKAIHKARIIAEEFERIGGGKVNVQELAREISSDH